MSASSSSGTARNSHDATHKRRRELLAALLLTDADVRSFAPLRMTILKSGKKEASLFDEELMPNTHLKS